MSLPTTTLTLLRRAFADVCRGYSAAPYKSSLIYVRHLSHLEHCGYEEIEQAFQREAISKGAQTEVEKLADIIRRGLWSQDKEDEIARQKDTIVRFEDGKKNLVVPSMIRRHGEQTKGERDKLNKMLVARAEQIGMTAELFAQQRLNDHYILNNIFVDPQLNTLLFEPSSFEDLSDSEIDEVVTVYNTATEPCSDANLRLLAVQDFFINYYSLCGDSLSDFFGRPISQMTYYMVRLGSIARYFRSIMEHTDLSKLSVEKRGDPDAIEQASISQRNQSQMAAEGKIPNVGLSASDVKEMGLEGQFAKLPQKNLDLQGMIEHVQKTSTPVKSV